MFLWRLRGWRTEDFGLYTTRPLITGITYVVYAAGGSSRMKLRLTTSNHVLWKICSNHGIFNRLMDYVTIRKAPKDGNQR